MSLVLRDVEIDGRAGLDLRIEEGRIAGIGTGLRGAAEMDGAGGALIPGLADHHIHILALAVQRDTIDLNGARDSASLAARIEAAATLRPPGSWLRASGYHETMAGELTRADLDLLAPRHPLRMQHQTGALWILNTAALTAVGAERESAACVERDAQGIPTGRIWRGDTWLRDRIGGELPGLDDVGHRLAALGITALCDASVTNDAASARYLAEAARGGALPQQMMLMSGEALEPPVDGAFMVGPVKVLLDDADLPDLDWFAAKIMQARAWARSVAVHCVTEAELALTLAAFDIAGSRPGDRIEHGGMIGADAIGELRRLGLTVVTQPGFLYERGDRYAAEIDPSEHADVYRCGSLLAAGVPVAAGSDAPYAVPDPWMAIRAAVDRRSAAGRVLGDDEHITAASALRLYLGALTAPGGAPRRIAVGERADFCLLHAQLREALKAPSCDLIRATFVAGKPIYQCS